MNDGFQVQIPVQHQFQTPLEPRQITEPFGKVYQEKLSKAIATTCSKRNGECLYSEDAESMRALCLNLENLSRQHVANTTNLQSSVTVFSNLEKLVKTPAGYICGLICTGFAIYTQVNEADKNKEDRTEGYMVIGLLVAAIAFVTFQAAANGLNKVFNRWKNSTNAVKDASFQKGAVTSFLVTTGHVLEGFLYDGDTQVLDKGLRNLIEILEQDIQEIPWKGLISHVMTGWFSQLRLMIENGDSTDLIKEKISNVIKLAIEMQTSRLVPYRIGAFSALLKSYEHTIPLQTAEDL